MEPNTQASLRSSFLADCERIHREWDNGAKSLDTDGLIALCAPDTILETPLVPAILAASSGSTARFDHFSRKARGAGRTS